MGAKTKTKAGTAADIKSRAATTKNGNSRKKVVADNISDNNFDDHHVVTDDEIRRAKEKILLVEEHLPPLSLVFIVLLCSGALLVLSLRDFASTGKVLLGQWDEAMLSFTKSQQWYDDSKGWKSTQGGFSAVMHTTTDENNMGGFFIRKLCGAAGVAVHFQKLLPLLFHPTGAKWSHGHFKPLLVTSLVANIALVTFYGLYLEDLIAAGVVELPLLILGLLAFESLAILFYLAVSPKVRGPAIALNGKGPLSVSSNIMRNTCLVVTTFFTVTAIRDVFFTGSIIDVIPRDDVYLEWTNSFLHSPPDNTPEAMDQGLEAPLHIGDKFMCQLGALHILINSMYKYVSCVGIRYGADGSGTVKAAMLWKGQAIGCALICFVYRIFALSAKSASFDFRWHLMLLGYEGFMFFVYGFM